MHSTQSSVVVFTASGSGIVAGLRASSQVGQSRAKRPVCPLLKQAPSGKRTAGGAAGGLAGALLGGGGGNTPGGDTILFGCYGTKG